MERVRRELARMRASADAWTDLDFLPSDGGERNAVRRATVLWGLQYDRGPADLPLVRRLLEQETACLRAESYPGHYEPELAGFLLASYRDVDDVWRQWAFKRATFDTWCGYDVEFVLAAGVTETLAFIRASDHPERDAALERLDREEVDLDEWWRHKLTWYPTDPADEDPLTVVERTMLVGERDAALDLLRRWAAGRERDASTLGQLQRRYADLAAWADAADAQRDLVPLVEGAQETASAWLVLAGHERRAGDHDAALAALRACATALDDVPGWREIGLGRMYVQALHALARDAPGPPGREALAAAERVAPTVPRLPPAAEDAARHG